MTYQLKIIIGSTRPSRKGPIVADWFLKIAQQHPNFEVELLDLKEINLPFMDEPEHPRLQKYTKAHTKKWSNTIDSADAFVIVTPEYNYGYPATLKNALDYLSAEWNEKPMAFVSYGGVSGGTRAVQDLKLPVTTLGMMPIPQAVNIPFFTQFINENNVFEANPPLERSATAMLNSLQRWTKALKNMRENHVE
ncbi:NADPH-dependent FMN reductase [Gelidibacter maritimus]|uniref:NAD(P)H-dependent oxidoreductase n=1 Tax=Gelidibacter maritimus TaxID=2761487 RepID=A0A7W2M686_9FLAO|nr:NAD(P)H-dependent oxidoreductase [Gelidibacter maritimus]MBA6153440.1 NAD(P)H-dependent oxidoreductase [Gelidibacter maritimus]